jgi:hypothetical protein
MTSHVARRLKRNEEEQDSPRELNADRAFRSAAFGLLPILFFLQVYASFLLVRVWLSREALDGKRRRRAWVAAAINMTVIAGFFLVIGAIILAAHNRPGSWFDLRTYRHPERMVGIWQGLVPQQGGEFVEIFELQADGRLKYRQAGAWELEGSGAWGYYDGEFLFCVHKVTKGSWEYQGQRIAFGLESITDNVMTLRTPEGVIPYTRVGSSGRK